MNIILPDGSRKEMPDGATCLDLAAAISPRLAREAVAAKVNDRMADLSTRLNENDSVAIVTFDSPEGKAVFWHSSSHIMAQAVQALFPNAKIAIGPAIDSGFYYDFDTPQAITPDDLPAIEKKCMEIARAKTPFTRIECEKQEAQAYFSAKNEIYKVELIGDIEGIPSMYAQGKPGEPGAWRDLCRGPHVPDTGYIKAIKITSIAGAYWRGSEKNKMLTRLYGISFPKQSMLDEYLKLLEEAAKRDHRRLGRDLDLFSFHNEGTGFPFWHGRGMILYNTIMDYSRARHVEAGYQEVKTPMILNEELWHRSGHWDKYRENMYFTTIDEVTHAVKPMNCPGGLLIYKNSGHSYKEFPVKYCEFGLVHRHEKAGVLHGLFRVRQFTQDDAHIFCLPVQIEPQIAGVIDFIIDMYRTFGFSDFAMELSTRPEKFMGSPELWDKAETALKNVLDAKKFAYKVNPGDGAFYGPKIDFHIKDCLKRSWQCGTVQLDFQMPERFELEYADADGTKKRPVMIHRALFGSMERFIGIMLEHYGGSMPLWLSPTQVRVLPISDKFMDHSKKVFEACKSAGLRVELDDRSEKVGYKIRDAETKKIPFMAIVGEKESEAGTVSVRRHKDGDQGAIPLNRFVELVVSEAKAPSVPQAGA